jgi:hypothetical protein
MHVLDFFIDDTKSFLQIHSIKILQDFTLNMLEIIISYNHNDWFVTHN